MSKKPTINDYQFSLWENSTHVSVSKCLFHVDAIPHVEKAIDSIMSQIELVRSKGMKLTDLPSARVPYTIYPHLHKGMLRFTADAGTKQCDFIILYHKHFAIGMIKQDVPRTTIYCDACGRKIEQRKRVFTHTWWQKLVRVFFHHAYEFIPETYSCCPEHGENYKSKIVTI